VAQKAVPAVNSETIYDRRVMVKQGFAMKDIGKVVCAI